jgi:hypothetical protein
MKGAWENYEKKSPFYNVSGFRKKEFFSIGW